MHTTEVLSMFPACLLLLCCCQALRKSFLALFTRKALSMYVQQQDKVIREHIAAWMEQQEACPGPVEVRDMVRDMNAATSQRVFVGEWVRKYYRTKCRLFVIVPGLWLAAAL